MRRVINSPHRDSNPYSPMYPVTVDATVQTDRHPLLKCFNSDPVADVNVHLKHWDTACMIPFIPIQTTRTAIM